MKKFLRLNIPSASSFTIVELVMIIVIIGILAAVTIPRFSTVFDMNLNSAAKKVAVDIEYSQTAALSRNANTRIVFDAGSDSYYAQVENNGSWEALADPVYRGEMQMDFKAADSRFKDVEIDSVDFNSGSTLQFNWEGVPADGSGSPLASDGSVSLSYRGNSLTLNVSKGTGKITVQ